MILIENQRICPQCNEVVSYDKGWIAARAKRENKPCKKCRNSILKLNSRIDPDIELKIIELQKLGKSKKEIRDSLKIGPKPVNRVFLENNLTATKKRIAKYSINDETRQCNECKEQKNINCFAIHTIDVDGNLRRNPKCINCISNRLKDIIYSSEEKFLKNKYNSFKGSCIRDRIIFDISFEQFYDQYLRQNKLCFYTDQEFDWGKKDETTGYWNRRRNALSVDKIIPEKGYVTGNFVFCCRRINTMKNDATLEEMKKWMPDWYNRISRHLEEEQR